jgi:regulatory protein YycH of two-component signal transduction system YycFG
MKTNEIDANQTQVKLSLPTLLTLLVTIGTFLTYIVIWGFATQTKADAATAKAVAVEVKVESMESDIRIIREAQIRMEVKMGMEPSYSKKDSK